MYFLISASENFGKSVMLVETLFAPVPVLPIIFHRSKVKPKSVPFRVFLKEL